MIDRIEELLAALAAEDEEEREDVLALTMSEEAAPVSPRGDGGTAGDGETGDRSGGRTAGEIALDRPGLIAGEIVLERPGLIAGEIVLERPGLIVEETEDRSGGRTAGEIALERPGLIAGETGDGEAGDRSGGRTAGEIWKDGPVWTVRSVEPEMDEVQRAAMAERTAQAEETLLPPRDVAPIWAGLKRTAGGGMMSPALENTGRSGPEQAGLKGLYRQTVQGLRPAAPALSPEQTGRSARAQEPGSAASLAVDELDRAVRRDSRRYDGGMSIY